MKLSKIINYLEEKFPIKLSEEWDNVGLLIGRRDKKISKVLLSLDITENVIDKAIEDKVDLIITHHPMIFKPMKAITADTVLGRKVLKLIENQIAVYTLHTNLDSGIGGLNDFLGEELLGLKKGKILDSLEYNGEEYGIGRVYKLLIPQNIFEFSSEIKEKLHLKDVVLTPYSDDMVLKKIAIVTGSGSSYWRKAKKMGADILITGDIKYHEAVDAKEENFVLMDIGHFESEWIFVKLLTKLLENEFSLDIIYFNDGPIFKRI